MQTSNFISRIARSNTSSLRSDGNPERSAAKNFSLRIWLLAILLWLPGSSIGLAQFNYATNEGAITIMGYTGAGGIVAIPSMIDGLPVTEVGGYAFYFNGSINSISIPDTVTNINKDAFEYCTGLTNITLGNNVLSIGDWAFSGCSGLTNVIFPNRLVHIGNWAFEHCSSLVEVALPASLTNLERGVFSDCSRLTAITVDPSNTAYSSSEGVLFNKDQKTLVQFPCGKAGNYTIPAGVGRIDVSAFGGCRLLTNVIIADSVTDIDYGAFVNCRGLTSVTLPNSITNLADSVFSYCTSLTNVNLPESIVHVGNGPFAVCYQLMTITVNAENPVYASLDGVLFDKGFNRLIQYPAGRAGSYTIPASVTNIGSGAFHGSKGLTDVAIPDNITTLPYWVFTGCGSLTNLTIPNQLTSLEDWAFDGCRSLTSIVIPNSVTNLGNWAFNSCGSLTSVRIGNQVTHIGSLAFNSCTSLVNVTIPVSVTKLGNKAFGNCRQLAGVYFQGNAPVFGSGVFDSDELAIVYYLPGTSGWGASTLENRPAVLWNPRIQTGNLTLGVQTNGFGFEIKGNTNLVLVVEACANLANPSWIPLQTNTFINGFSYFNDCQWTNFPARFYRLRSP